MATTPYIGEIRPFSFQRVPKGWAQCNGQLLPINQNQALYAILGTTYGGDGRTTFALPNLQGRVPVGGGISNPLGTLAGSATVTLNSSQIPTHTHNANGSSASVTGSTGSGTPGTNVLPGTFPTGNYYGNNSTAQFGAAAVSPAGNQAHENRQPYLALNFCVALVGIFPPRS